MLPDHRMSVLTGRQMRTSCRWPEPAPAGDGGADNVLPSPGRLGGRPTQSHVRADVTNIYAATSQITIKFGPSGIRQSVPPHNEVKYKIHSSIFLN